MFCNRLCYVLQEGCMCMCLCACTNAYLVTLSKSGTDYLVFSFDSFGSSRYTAISSENNTSFTSFQIVILTSSAARYMLSRHTCIILFFFLRFIYLFMRDTQKERQRHRQREKEAPCREPDVGSDPGALESCPEPKTDVQSLSQPGVPTCIILDSNMNTLVSFVDMAHVLWFPGSNIAITVIFYIPAHAQKK